MNLRGLPRCLWYLTLLFFVGTPLLLRGGEDERALSDEPGLDLRAFLLSSEQTLQLLVSPDLQEHLIDRSFGRAASCPLRSELKQLTIFQRIELIATGLRYGRCYDTNKEYVDGLQKMVAPPSVPVPTVAGGPVAMTYNSQIFNSLNAITSNNDCLMNIKERGLLPVVADVVTSAGLVSALMPTPNGFLMGATGLTIGSSLRVLNRLFAAPFIWRKTSDRKQFLDLNCAFFDLRRDIEAAELFDLRDEHRDEHIEKIKKLRTKIIEQISGVKTKIAALEQQVTEKKRVFVQQRCGQDALTMVARLEALLPVLRASSEIAWINAGLEAFGEIAAYLRASVQVPAYGSYLQELLQRFLWSKAADLVAIEASVFAKNQRLPLEFYLAQYAADLRKIVEAELRGFWQSPSHGSPQETNREHYDRCREALNRVLNPLEESLARLDIRLQVILAKHQKNTFSADDEGAHGSFDIISEYLYIQKNIFGSLGYGFMHHFVRALDKELNEFSRAYQLFLPRMFLPLSTADAARWDCRNVGQLRVVWEQAHSAAEVANDFIETNRGVFHHRFDHVRFFIKFIPLGRSYPNQIFRMVRSAEFAKEVLAGREILTPDKVVNMGWTTRQGLGRLMLELIAHEPQRQLLEEYWQKNKCVRFL